MLNLNLSLMQQALRSWVNGSIAGEVASAVFDFENNRYAVNQSRVGSGDLFTFSQDPNLTYIDRNGVLQQASATEPAIDFSNGFGAISLPIESTNLIADNTPENDTFPSVWQSYFNPAGFQIELIETGVDNGIEYVDIRFHGNTSANEIQFRFGDRLVTLPDTTVTHSCYLKLIDGSLDGISQANIRINWLDGFALLSNDSNLFMDDISEDEWFRADVTGSESDVNTDRVLPIIQLVAGQTDVDVTLRIGLPQLEEQPSPTPVIKTYSGSVTRGNPTCQIDGTNFTDFYNQDEGTFFIEYIQPYEQDGTARIFDVNDGGVSDWVELSSQGGQNGNAVYSVRENNTSPVNSDLGVASHGGIRRAAIACKTDDFAGIINEIVSDNSGTFPSNLAELNFGYNAINSQRGNIFIKYFSYYPARLSNAKLEQLVTFPTPSPFLFTNPVNTSPAVVSSPSSAPSTTGMTNVLPIADGYADTFTASVTDGSAVLTGITDTSGLSVGQPLRQSEASGSPYPDVIPVGAEILSIDSSTQITMNKAAIGTNASQTILTFSENIKLVNGVASGDDNDFTVGLPSATSASRSVKAVDYALEFVTDSKRIVLDTNRNGATPNQYKIAINDEYLTSEPVDYGASDDTYLLIELTRAGTQKVRIEFPDKYTLSELWINSGSTISKPTEDKPLVAFWGDSYFDGGGPDSWQLSNCAARVADALQYDPHINAVSGTGYVSNGGVNYNWQSVERLDDINVGDYEKIIMIGSVNDGGTPQSTIRSAALATWLGLRSRKPDIPIIIFGCPRTNNTTEAAALTIEAGQQQAFSDWADGNAYYFPITGDPDGAWLNDANVDTYISSDGSHLNEAGQEYFAGLMVEKMNSI